MLKPNVGHLSRINQSPNKKFIWYFLIVSILCGLPAFILFSGHDDVLFLYVLLQFITLCIAAFHIYFINEKLVWDDEMIFTKKLMFTCGITICGMLIFFSLCKYLIIKDYPEYSILYVTSLLIFIVPIFVIATFEKAMNLQPKKYKLWFYSDSIKAPDPDLIDFSNSYLLSFEFPKKYNDTVISNFKFKAPIDMQFGELFYNYLLEYNDTHRESIIEYQDMMSKSYGWLFYVKAKYWWNSEKIIDPHLTIRQNKVLEHNVIIPKRFIVE